MVHVLNSQHFLSQELEEMRRKMEEEIREQLLANQQMLAANEDSAAWAEQVSHYLKKM